MKSEILNHPAKTRKIVSVTSVTDVKIALYHPRENLKGPWGPWLAWRTFFSVGTSPRVSDKFLSL